MQPENGFSMPLCAATAILLSCQSQTAWLTLSVVPPLNSGGLLLGSRSQRQGRGTEKMEAGSELMEVEKAQGESAEG